MHFSNGRYIAPVLKFSLAELNQVLGSKATTRAVVIVLSRRVSHQIQYVSVCSKTRLTLLCLVRNVLGLLICTRECICRKAKSIICYSWHIPANNCIGTFLLIMYVIIWYIHRKIETLQISSRIEDIRSTGLMASF